MLSNRRMGRCSFETANDELSLIVNSQNDVLIEIHFKFRHPSLIKQKMKEEEDCIVEKTVEKSIQ